MKKQIQRCIPNFEPPADFCSIQSPFFRGFYFAKIWIDGEMAIRNLNEDYSLGIFYGK